MPLDKSLVAQIAQHAQRTPNKLAIEAPDGKLTYSQLMRKISSVAANRRWSGVIFIFLPQGSAAVSAFFGVMAGGGIPALMPLPSAKQDPAYYWNSHLDLVQLTKVTAIITNSENKEAVSDHFSNIDVIVFSDLQDVGTPVEYLQASDTAFLQHSSGTTGLKKGVALSHRAVTRQILSYAASLRLSERHVIVSWLPIYHDMGLIACTIMPLCLGLTVIMLDPFAWVARPRSLLEAVDRYGGTHVWLPNFAFAHICRTTKTSGLNLSSVEAIISCSETVKLETMVKFIEHFSSTQLDPGALQACYALAEAVFAVTQTPWSEPFLAKTFDRAALDEGKIIPAGEGVRLVSSGRVIDGVQVRISGSSDVGEILIEADFLFDGYYGRPDLTRQKLDGRTYSSGDLGFIYDSELFVLGRKDDLIIVHGKNFYAHEIEAAAGRAGLKPGRSVAFGVPNPLSGSQEAVLVTEGADLDPGLIAAVRAEVFNSMALELYEIKQVPHGWLVKTTSGKISRAENIRRYIEEKKYENVK